MQRLFLVLASVLAACTAGDVPVGVQAAPPPSPWLELGVSALDAGEPVVLQVHGAVPGARVWFLYGSAYGAGDCPAALGGDCLSITAPVRTIGGAIADAAGDAALVTVAPPWPPGHAVAIQAVTLRPFPQLSEPQERVTRAFGSTASYGVGATWQPVDATFLRGGLLIADTVDLAEPVTVTGFTCQGRTLGGSFRAALYDDDGFHPGHLVAQSGAVHVNVGPNTGPNLTPPAVLQPGRYWLAVVFDSLVDTWENGLSPDNPEFLGMHTFNLPMPDPLTSGTAVTGARLACSVEVQ